MKRRITFILLIFLGSIITLWSSYNIYNLFVNIGINESNRHSIVGVSEKNNPANDFNKVYEIIGAHYILFIIVGLIMIIIGIRFLRKN